MDRGKNQLRERLLAKFLKNPEYLSSTRVMQGLFREEGQCLQEIFQARYDPLFLQNITSKTVFFQTMDNLAIMVACNLGLKNANKTLKNLIFSNDTFLFNFLALLFTDKEKQIVFDRLNSKFNSRAEEQRQFECEENEASNEKEEGLHTLFYILKNLLRIRSEENLQEQHEELDQSF